MSSPGARQRRRRQQYQTPRTRRELATAIGVSVGIVGGTALMIWLLRPGGLADRQPRSSWLIGVVLAAVIAVCWSLLRPQERERENRYVLLSGLLGGILVISVVAGFKWPGGLLRHTPKLPEIPTTPTPTPAPSALTTTAPGATTTAKPGGTTATTIPKTTPSTAPAGSPSQP
jgi:hypothetical protein